MAREHVGMGTLDACPTHMREIFKGALLHNSRSIILVHNHPSGDSTPSIPDRQLARRVEETGKVIGIAMDDSIIIGHGECSSFRQGGRKIDVSWASGNTRPPAGEAAKRARRSLANMGLAESLDFMTSCSYKSNLYSCREHLEKEQQSKAPDIARKLKFLKRFLKERGATGLAWEIKDIAETVSQITWGQAEPW